MSRSNGYQPNTLIRRANTILALLLFWSLQACTQISSSSLPDLGMGDPSGPDQQDLPPEAPISLAVEAPLMVTDPLAESRITELVGQMTLDEKLGQMTQGDKTSVSFQDVATYFLGSVLSGGGNAPAANTPQGWAKLSQDYQQKALSTRLKIPLIYGIDAVHGHNNVINATIFPHNIGLGATRDPDLVRKIAEATAAEILSTGLDWTFAPCLAVARDDRWGRTYESFGESPELVSLLTGPYVSGLQNTLVGKRRVIGTAKHFLADGGTAWGTGHKSGIDRGDARIDEATLRAIHLPAYRQAVQAGVGTVMASYSSWNGVKMHASKVLLTDLLKGELGFDGFVISDWDAIQALPGTFSDQVVSAVNAGVDMFMFSADWKKFITTLRQAVLRGAVSEARINDAVARILRVKQRAGLFEQPQVDSAFVGSALGSTAHRQLAREAVQKSLVLLKNQDDLLPLQKSLSKVFVAGRAANDLGRQCGGWTITWQGSLGPITQGTTLLEGLQKTHGGKITYSKDGLGAAGHDVAVVAIGENPYAEYEGDNPSLQLSAEDLDTLGNVQASGIKIVVVLLSGRPLIVTEQIDRWDAFVAAWLPGSEGQGIADLLFGDRGFTGKLPSTWPRSADQHPINVGDPTYQPLFPYSFGLTTQPRLSSP